MSNKSTGCFKYGCVGCISVIALGFGLIFLLSAVQFASQTDPDPVQQATEQNLPEAPPLPAGDASADRPQTIEIDGETPLISEPQTAGGTLVLDLAMGDFVVRPGPAGQPIRVNADFDASGFELKEDYSVGKDGRWQYKVSFGGKGGFFGAIFGSGNNSHNEVEITIPRGHPIRIVGDIGMGETKMDFGGLWVQEVDLEFGPGDHFIEFREPVPFPMTRFAVDSSMGEMEIRGLGDASPKMVSVDHSMGELFVDLQGAWRQNAEAKVSFSMGGCRVWVPEEARVDLQGGKVAMGESVNRLPDYSELPEDAPVITLNVRGSMGELRIEH